MMPAEPFDQSDDDSSISKQFINDLKAILNQNRSIAEKLPTREYLNAPISDVRKKMRSMSVSERLAIYKSDPIQD